MLVINKSNQVKKYDIINVFILGAYILVQSLTPLLLQEGKVYVGHWQEKIHCVCSNMKL